MSAPAPETSALIRRSSDVHPGSRSSDKVTVADSALPVVDAVELGRSFSGRRAVRGVSLQLRAGQCLALFGPNGAGKTTLLRILGGQIRASEGHVDLLGRRLPGDASTRRLVGVISHHTMLYAALSAYENVLFAAECQGIVNASAAATRALERLRVGDRAETPVRLLSRGLQQRVSIARALVHEPRLLLLDEPYTGLDEVGAGALTDALRQLLADGSTLVLVTHHLGEGLALATRAAIMLDGRVIRNELAPAAGFDSAAYSRIYRGLVTRETA
ncbi:MAG: ABC transporter ATP-binding protein [Gemmatimonadota bacterium]|nr:ABC transporter ATP-binding protein [Gemmatimonadota bacterium]